MKCGHRISKQLKVKLTIQLSVRNKLTEIDCDTKPHSLQKAKPKKDVVRQEAQVYNFSIIHIII